VTNSLSFLPQCDQVVMLENGSIAEVGSYESLLAKTGPFATFIKSYLANNTNTNANYGDQQVINGTDQDPVESTKSPQSARSPKTSIHLSKEALNKEILNKSDETKQPLLGAKDKTNDKLAGESIIKKEKIESGKVKMSVLVEYFRACGPIFVTFFMVVFTLSNFLSIAGNYWLSYWTKDAETIGNENKTNVNSESQKYVNFGIYSAIGLAQCLTSLLSDFVFLVMCLAAAKLLHESMFFSILRSTMEFFESTPSGRIINRFSKGEFRKKKIFFFFKFNFFMFFFFFSHSKMSSRWKDRYVVQFYLFKKVNYFCVFSVKALIY
jgi:ATP-binding cassette subfamily C (CFTR/MRP) protein 1